MLFKWLTILGGILPESENNRDFGICINFKLKHSDTPENYCQAYNFLPFLNNKSYKLLKLLCVIQKGRLFTKNVAWFENTRQRVVMGFVPI